MYVRTPRLGDGLAPPVYAAPLGPAAYLDFFFLPKDYRPGDIDIRPAWLPWVSWGVVGLGGLLVLRAATGSARRH